MAQTTLVTGFPQFTARKLIEELLSQEEGRVIALVRTEDEGDAKDFRSHCADARRLSVVVGDVTSMDLGLSGSEYRSLVREVNVIHHLAARYHLGVAREAVIAYNTGGTRGALELALECKALERFCYWSTVHVSGEREGVVMEDDLSVGQRFRNAYEESKYAAEKIVRSMSRRIPTTVFRPGIIVGDSKSGEIGRYDGPYHLIGVMLAGPMDFKLPLPGRGDGPFHLVPIDYVVGAARRLAADERGISRTFHLVDPSPLSARAVYELVAERANRVLPRRTLPQGVARALLKLPWMGKLKGSPRTIMEGFNQQVCYNCRNTLDILRTTALWCPSFDSYVDNLVRFFRESQVVAREDDVGIVDPLD